MPELGTLLLFSVAALALLLIPGPAVLYIVTRSIDQGRVAGLVSVLGVHTGTMVHIAAAALGLSALLLSSALAFHVVRYLGAAYLVYIGVRRLLSKDEEELDPDAEPARLSVIYRQGVVVNVLNPKTALFFFAFLPQFVDTGAGSVTLQVLILGATFSLLGLISDSLYALIASALGGWLKRGRFFARVRRWVSGGIYAALGLTAAFSGGKASV
ncbi:MAG: LysE family translocator [Dehalococcoidia bacterium]